jgi:hypothetical protein
MNVKRIWFLLILVLLGEVVVGQANAGPDQTICKGQKTTIDDPKSGSNADCVTGATPYVWTIRSGDMDMSHISCTTCVKPVVKPIKTTKYRLTHAGKTDDVEVKVNEITDVKFEEIPTKKWKWGIDNWKNFGSVSEDGNIYNTKDLILSIEKGQKDKFKIITTINPNTQEPTCLFLQSTNADSLLVRDSAIKTKSHEFELEAKCNNNNSEPCEYKIWARYGKGGETVQPANGNNPISKVDVVEYKKRVIKAEIIVVNQVATGNNWSSSSVPSLADAISYINDSVYHQAVLYWEIEPIIRICNCNFDVNQDTFIDVSNGWTSREMDTVIKYCQNPNPDIFNIFMVDNPSDSSLGFSDIDNERYAFIHPDMHFNNFPISLYNTMCHEAGHAFGLHHPFDGPGSCVGTSRDQPYIDPSNVMDYCDNPKLRKFQWDILHPTP